MNLAIEHHGIMLTDYFCGTAGVTLPVYITPETTYKESLAMLEEEIDAVWDHVEYTARYNDFDGDLETKIKSKIKEMMDNCTKNGVLDTPIAPYMEYSEEGENAVLIFSIEFID